MLRDDEVAGIRRDAEENLPNVGRVLVHKRQEAGGGGTRDAFTAGVDLPCAIAPISSAASSIVAGEQIHEDATHVVTFPAATTIRTVDRVEVADVVYIVLGGREFGGMTFSRRVQVKPL